MHKQLSEIPAFQLACRSCNIIFFVCRPCWRGHAYCSRACAQSGRLASLRKAQQKVLSTPLGRERNRIRQKEFRTRRLAAIEPSLPPVTHHTTTLLPTMLAHQREKMRGKRCAFCKQHIRFSFSRELGRSLRRLTIKLRKESNDIYRNMGRDPPKILC